MLFFGIKNRWFRLGIFTVFSGWALLFIAWMYNNYYVTDPYNPNLSGTEAYGHNGYGAFAGYAKMMLVENFILLAVLLPYSFSRYYWLRTLILQFIFGGWCGLMMIASMHNGSVHLTHLLWLFGVNIIIFILFCLSLVAEFSRKYRNEQAENY